MRIFLIFLCLFISFTTYSQIKLPRLISDGMILQRDTKIKLWGWATPNEKVSLTFLQRQYGATANKEGKWVIELPAQKAGGPFQMTFSGSNVITLKDILFGDVWVCSGQSNMELTMDRVQFKYPDIIANANYPHIRQFEVPDQYHFQKKNEDLTSGQWVAADPKSIYKFSAVAYFFALDLYKAYKVPIGLINAALGGSPAEAWMSEEALKKFPTQYSEAQKFKDNNHIAQIEAQDRKAQSDWIALLNSLDEGLKSGWARTDLDDKDWSRMTIPGYWADGPAGNVNGVMWFRKYIEVPRELVGQAGVLQLGRIVDADSVFINGQFIGTTGYQYPPRRYPVAANHLKEGKNLITVRVVNQSGKGGFVTDKPYELTVGDRVIDLKGEWSYKLGATMKAMPGQTVIRWKPTGLFNAMIAPLTNYSIKGVIWYQGESNTGAPQEYKELMQTLISDWRMHWNKGAFPFLYVQLANFMEPQSQPVQSNWAALRQAQLETLALPNTGMVVAIDLGEWNDIHPLNKQDVGKRLALQAKRLAYGDNKTIASGPLYQSMERNGGKLILTFSNTGSGLMAKANKELKHFAIAGADKKFVWAKTQIMGNKVIVWNDAITTPVAVRYAWADNPEGANLYNKNGLPASPFEATLKLP